MIRIDFDANLLGQPAAVKYTGPQLPHSRLRRRDYPDQMARNSPSAKDSTAIAINPGLRERKKAQKAELICKAARHLFMTKGYEATTLREVAQLADVGFGTVFSYATDKSGLLAMIFVEDLRHLPPPFDSTPGESDLLEALTRSFMKLFEFWGRNPTLSRIVLPQMEFYGLNPFTEAIRQRRLQAKAELEAWITRLQEARRIRANIDAAQAAETLFAIYTSCLREWITCDPLDMAAGRRLLRRLLALPLGAIVRQAR
jgi:AcrR family transcriptional regulator